MVVERCSKLLCLLDMPFALQIIFLVQRIICCLMIEFQWVQKRLHEEAALGHLGAVRMSKLLEILWDNPFGTCWDLADRMFPR